MKRTITVIILSLLIQSVFAENYYISAAGDDVNSGTSVASPWETLEKLDESTFKAGDVIHFNRGDKWLGRFEVTESGEVNIMWSYTLHSA